jgi:hypothetical protein
MLSSPLVDIKTTEPVILGQGQWITLEQLHYFDINGVKRPWERCVRKNTAAPLADGMWYRQTFKQAFTDPLPSFFHL